MNLTVLKNYRGYVEEGLRLELAALERKLRSAEEGLARLESAADEGARSYLNDTKAGLTAVEVVGRYQAWEGIEEAIRKSREIVAGARRARDAKMEEVLEASKEKKQVELLEQREQGQKRRGEVRREQRTMDEAAAIRHGRERLPETGAGGRRGHAQ